VFGVGSAAAELMFVGEGPGFHEDRQGEPFVGQAGKLLTELLAGIGLSRPEVYIANVLKCRPPENRDPAPEEIEACSPYLMEQIGLIRPRVICTLGRFATKLLADTELGISAIHGKAKARELDRVAVVVFPVFHPAAALYTPANRKVLEVDFAKLRVLLDKGPEALSQEATAAASAGREFAGLSDTSSSSGPGPLSGPAGRQASGQTEQLPLW
jgi:uracil-DNA glycosylase family 4